MGDMNIIINGTNRTIDKSTINPQTTLNDYLRNNLDLTGTKYMCREGGCGACIVVAHVVNPDTNIKKAIAVNSCLVSLLSCEGWEIVTIEGLGNRYDGYDEAQQKIVQFNGTQCGFCTPGMVMNMHALQESGQMTMAEIENSFGGNICRCTGYRPILTAFKSMASDKDEKLLGVIPDIEDLKLCMKSKCQSKCRNGQKEVPCSRGKLDKKNLKALEIQDWYKVYTVDEIFAIFQFRGDTSYRLVAGNTAKGVYKDMAKADYYIDIQDVSELRSYTLDTSKLVLGGNVTISEAMDIFRDVSGRDDSFKYLTTLVEHLDLVATVPVRNIGTLAGNLTIKHVHNEFPSDIFLLLEVIGAYLILDNGHEQEVVTPKEFLGIDMNHKIIRKIEIPPLDSSYKLETYKIRKRYQNTHAIVNAGFLFQFSDERMVASARIVFGGINPQFVHANSSEAFITGRDLFNNSTMQGLFTQLYNEVLPIFMVPEPSPEYRRQLAIALTYKYFLSIAPSYLVTEINKTGGEKLIRPAVSTGAQDYVTNATMYPIGQPITKLEAADQASGSARFITDLPDLHGQTFAAFVLGKAPAGSTVTSIDASAALSTEGVLAFYQASDIDGINSFMAPNSVFLYQVDEPIFIGVNDTLKYFYQPVGMIVAESRILAEEAAEMVKVQYSYSTVSPMISVRDVLEQNDYTRVHHLQSVLPGPITNDSLTTTTVVHGSVDTPYQYHYYMELQVANVVPEDNGSYSIFPTTQWLDGAQFAVARALKLPANTLNLSVKRLGGSHGGKITRNIVTCAATLAALKLHRPVKFHLPLETGMNIMGKRMATASNYEVSFMADGTISSLKNDIYSNLGAYGNALVDIYLLDPYLRTYASSTYSADTYWVRTDVPASTYMRAPGTLEGGAIIHSIIEHVAYALDMDPVDVRLRNLNPKYSLMIKIFNDCLAWSDYRLRRAEIEEYNKVNRWRKRGIAIIPMVYNLIFLSPHYVQISVYQADGTVAITHGGIEVGQGINTKVAQVAAYLLSIDINTIKIKATNNFVAPNNMTTAGSITTEAIIIALKVACNKLKDRIDKAAANKLPADASWLAKVRNAVTSGVSLTENQMFSDDLLHSANYPVFGAAVAEVEVDVLTGSYIVQRVDLMEDTGDSLNPDIDIGQCEGAFVMGVGDWTTEEIIFDHDGALATNNTWTYKTPGARDIPVDFRVKFPAGNPNLESSFKNKSTSEPPLCLSVSVPLAIRHAVKSARLQSNPNADPWTPMNGPTTTEWTFMNCLNSYKQYQL